MIKSSSRVPVDIVRMHDFSRSQVTECATLMNTDCDNVHRALQSYLESHTGVPTKPSHPTRFYESTGLRRADLADFSILVTSIWNNDIDVSTSGMTPSGSPNGGAFRPVETLHRSRDISAMTSSSKIAMWRSSAFRRSASNSIMKAPWQKL